MVQVQPVDSLDLPELAPYRTMRRQQEQREAGIFVAEGEKVVRRLLESELEVVSLLLPSKWAREYDELLSRRPEKTLPVFTADRKLLERLTGFSMYQGVLAVARVPKPANLADLFATAPRPLLFLAVEGLSSAENLGGLVRSCAALGATGLIVGETCCSPWLRRSVRSSMGAIFQLPIVETPSLRNTLDEAKTAGIRLIAAHPHTNERTLAETSFATDSLIVLGSEGSGISEPVLSICNEKVLIPMSNDIDSLNVGTAGALFLYEATRQRRHSEISKRS
jgi:tRNA G18 (ribose-2'-O)-methylase SpoU